MKAKRSSRKREHSVKNKVFLANEKQGISSKRSLLGSNHLFQQTKQNKIENKSKDAPRKTHSA
jgi:hypothetical protein